MPDFNSWERWKKAKDFCDRQMKKAWMKGGNCDSCCPRCKQWESSGNTITTVSVDDYEFRTCSGCGYIWKAIFTPVGFVEVKCMENKELVNGKTYKDGFGDTITVIWDEKVSSKYFYGKENHTFYLKDGTAVHGFIPDERRNLIIGEVE